MNKPIEKARIVWEIVAVVVAVIGVVVTVVVSVATYNSRYDSSAVCADGFKITFNSTSNAGASTLSASAGSVWYGAFQKSGKSGTSYDFYYKKTTSSKYGDCVNTVTFDTNGTSGKHGDWRLARSNNAQKYDVKVKRTSHKKSKSVLRVDWSVDSYDSTGN